MSNGMFTHGPSDQLERRWAQDARWQGIRRDYSADAVDRLRPSIKIEYSVASHGAQRLWELLQKEKYVATFGALTGAQAVQMVKAGLTSLYLSGWQVAADSNLSGQTYPDQSLYPSNSVPTLIRRLNNALLRADQIQRSEGTTDAEWLVAIVPHADMLWFQTSKHDLKQAREFAEAIHAHYPGKLLAYNCSPAFNWKQHLDDKTIQHFQGELGEMGYKFQFITLAGWHNINLHTFDLAQNYKKHGMSAYVELQEREFAAEQQGYTAVRHQREVGTGYFDLVLQTVTGGLASTTALSGSTEMEQFH